VTKARLTLKHAILDKNKLGRQLENNHNGLQFDRE
jgi:hypothetical protein